MTSVHPCQKSFLHITLARVLKVDLVTETDQKCEALLLERLRAAAADYRFIGEQPVAVLHRIARDGKGIEEHPLSTA